MTKSGQVLAQRVQPIQIFSSMHVAVRYPLLLKSGPIIIIFFGHIATHSPQPLHLSFLNTGLGIIFSPLPHMNKILKRVI